MGVVNWIAHVLPVAVITAAQVGEWGRGCEKKKGVR